MGGLEAGEKEGWKKIVREKRIRETTKGEKHKSVKTIF